MTTSSRDQRVGAAYRHSMVLSVRGHLGAVVAVLAIVLATVGVVQSSSDFRTARRQAGIDAASQARLAAGALSESLEDASGFTASTAANPSVAQLFATIDGQYEHCSLTAGGTGVFVEGDIHFLDGTGFLFCSSAGQGIDRRDLHYGPSAWFERAMKNTSAVPVQTGPFVDPATAKRSLGFAAPVRDQQGKGLGVVVYALPVAGVADQLTATYGARGRFSFEMSQTTNGEIVSSSEIAPSGLAAAAPTAAPLSSATRGLDGVRRFYRAVPAGETGFTVRAGASEAMALENARRDLRGHLILIGLAVAITLILGLVVNGRIATPMRRLTSAVEQAGRAVIPEPVAVSGPREVRRLVDRFNAMIATQARTEERLRQHAFSDELTGLPNRAVAIDRLTHALERTRRGPEHIAVLSVDLDRFGLVNDSLGRDVGDRMLIDVASRIRSAVRPGDTISRFHGDEFIVICEGLSSRAEAGAVADRIAATLADPIREGDVQATISASIGVALGRYEEDTAETMLRDADAAMSEAKARGKARYAFFEPMMRERARNRLDLENDLRQALLSEELVLAYQPIIDLQTGRVAGAEALVRWHHPTKGVLLPGVFIGLAEDTGLIVPIGLRVFEQACVQAKAWADQGRPIRVSVNLSARQLADPNLGRDVGTILVETRLDPSLVCVEVTESTLMHGDSVPDVLDDLRRLGMRISVDDFGTGYSSLAYLQRFPIDELKVDRAFVQDLGRGPKASALVAAIVGMAEALGLSVVAEGVETSEQLAELRALGCDRAQGFLFMRPEPARALTSLLELDALDLETPALQE